MAYAAPTSGGVLPWETPLVAIYTSVTGPVAVAVAGIGFVTSGAMLVFGGDMPEFARRICYLALVTALIVAAAGIMSSLFSTGALI